MVDPGEEGERLYNTLWNHYDMDQGANVVGISGSQGSVKTSACLDLAEKKMSKHPDEKIFWRETLNSPMQCERLTEYPVKYFVEQGLQLKFISSDLQKEIKLDKVVFNDFDTLYSLAEYQTLNVVFFNSKKSWTHLIEYCNSESQASGDWQTIFLDEMEGLYPAGSNNQTEERWWDWSEGSGHVIKECRKSNTHVIGNYHDENLIDYRITNKFMFFMYGFGAIVNRSKSRVVQSCVDQCVKGEFWIAHGRHRFGKIKIKKYFPPSKQRIIAKKV